MYPGYSYKLYSLDCDTTSYFLSCLFSHSNLSIVSVISIPVTLVVFGYTFPQVFQLMTLQFVRTVSDITMLTDKDPYIMSNLSLQICTRTDKNREKE